MKKIVWEGSARRDLLSFPASARREAGYELYNIQIGLQPDDWRSMPDVGAGVEEIRIHEENEYRIIYIARFDEAVYVLHCFVKKSQKTPKHDLELAKQRYKQVMIARKAT